MTRSNLTPLQLIYRRGPWHSGMGTSELVARFRYVRVPGTSIGLVRSWLDSWHVLDRKAERLLSRDEAEQLTLKQATEAYP